MKNKKGKFKVIIILSLLLFISIAFTFFTGYSLVLPITTDKKIYLNAKLKPGDTIAIFQKFDFSRDNWKAYLAIGFDDLNDLPPAIPKYTCLKTSNRKLLRQMQKSWKFKITNGDAGTVASGFYLYKNGKLVYKTGIILLKTSQRLQNEEFGEMIPINSKAMLNTCRQFHRVYWYVVFL
jgi:hypothetical protein